ncbi:MAG: hypothetical protein LBK13_10705 [Spirochaetales bacterium]|jgi:hypothetical protein|nr:hypothetical protein [Spirochaetales bacterium]
MKTPHTLSLTNSFDIKMADLAAIFAANSTGRGENRKVPGKPHQPEPRSFHTPPAVSQGIGMTQPENRPRSLCQSPFLLSLPLPDNRTSISPVFLFVNKI